MRRNDEEAPTLPADEALTSGARGRVLPGDGSPPVVHPRYCPRMPDPANWRRALSVLADYPEGCTKALLMAHGFTTKLVADLIESGLVSARPERSYVGGRPHRVMRIKITDAGRAALGR